MSDFESNNINIYGERGKTWLKNLPTIIKSLATKYELSDLQPINNLSFNYVESGFKHEQPIILKIGLDIESFKKEAACLKVFAGFGAVDLIAEEDGVLLLERAITGESLKSYLPNKKNEAREIACAITKKLHQAPKPRSENFSNIRDWLTALDKDLGVPTVYISKARKLRDRLLKSSTEQILLHGDLHHDNIISHGTEWKIIDPKGIIGYPIFEVWGFVLDIEKDPIYIANYFGFNLQDVRDWYFVHLILAICWNLEDGIDPKLFMGLVPEAYRYVS